MIFFIYIIEYTLILYISPIGMLLTIEVVLMITSLRVWLIPNKAQPSVLIGLRTYWRYPCVRNTIAPKPIQNIRATLDISPQKAPIELAQGKYMPSVKTPKRGPPANPNILKTA